MTIEPEFVMLMRAHLPVQTRGAISDALGISANTWSKIKAGEPIRMSVATRLIDRLDRITLKSE